VEFAAAYEGCGQASSKQTRPMDVFFGGPMKKFLRVFCHGSIVILVAAFALIVVAPACQAQSSTPLDKHARKIEKRLAKFRPGTYLDFEFRDRSETYGSLGTLSEASFQFTNADSNKTETHLYADVARVKKAKEYIGAGSEPEHHVHLLVPLLIGAGAAAAAVAVVEVER
jgi:hypothetical protein